MKVTINSDGSVSFDVGSAAEALALAKELQNGHKPVAEVPTFVEPKLPEVKLKRPVKRERSNNDLYLAAKETGLSVAQYVVWDYLVSCESDTRGVSLSELARHFHLTNSAVGQRVYSLMKLGYAERVGSARYKAATPA